MKYTEFNEFTGQVQESAESWNLQQNHFLMSESVSFFTSAENLAAKLKYLKEESSKLQNGEFICKFSGILPETPFIVVIEMIF